MRSLGYLAHDAHAADLLFQVVSRRNEHKAIVITTNSLHRDAVFLNAAWAKGQFHVPATPLICQE